MAAWVENSLLREARTAACVPAEGVKVVDPIQAPPPMETLNCVAPAAYPLVAPEWIVVTSKLVAEMPVPLTNVPIPSRLSTSPVVSTWNCSPLLLVNTSLAFQRSEEHTSDLP